MPLVAASAYSMTDVNDVNSHRIHKGNFNLKGFVNCLIKNK